MLKGNDMKRLIKIYLITVLVCAILPLCVFLIYQDKSDEFCVFNEDNCLVINVKSSKLTASESDCNNDLNLSDHTSVIVKLSFKIP